MKWTRMGFLRCTAVFAMALSVSVSWRQPSAAVETEPVTGRSTEAAKEVIDAFRFHAGADQGSGF